MMADPVRRGVEGGALQTKDGWAGVDQGWPRQSQTGGRMRAAGGQGRMRQESTYLLA